MEYKITGCKPEKLFHFFEDISAIPRGSGNEKGLSDYLVKFAKDRNLWVYQDESNNVIIKKEGSEGAKDKAPVMLQGHIDMVCDKLAGVEHDFEKDGLDLIVKDGVLYANGTTLGADNGVAVALMMTVPCFFVALILCFLIFCNNLIIELLPEILCDRIADILINRFAILVHLLCLIRRH